MEIGLFLLGIKIFVALVGLFCVGYAVYMFFAHLPSVMFIDCAFTYITIAWALILGVKLIFASMEWLFYSSSGLTLESFEGIAGAMINLLFALLLEELVTRVRWLRVRTQEIDMKLVSKIAHLRGGAYMIWDLLITIAVTLVVSCCTVFPSTVIMAVVEWLL